MGPKGKTVSKISKFLFFTIKIAVITGCCVSWEGFSTNFFDFWNFRPPSTYFTLGPQKLLRWAISPLYFLTVRAILYKKIFLGIVLNLFFFFVFFPTYWSTNPESMGVRYPPPVFGLPESYGRWASWGGAKSRYLAITRTPILGSFEALGGPGGGHHGLSSGQSCPPRSGGKSTTHDDPHQGLLGPQNCQK